MYLTTLFFYDPRHNPTRMITLLDLGKTLMIAIFKRRYTKFYVVLNKLPWKILKPFQL